MGKRVFDHHYPSFFGLNDSLQSDIRNNKITRDRGLIRSEIFQKKTLLNVKITYL